MLLWRRRVALSLGWGFFFFLLLLLYELVSKEKKKKMVFLLLLVGYGFLLREIKREAVD